ncbi:MAG TPA: HEAT repeat domain-containing protein, partial [Planctomycetota bacterium]|nr:HEAT repeat domain-containing protein [Planctomycetota bacterium]
PDIAALLQGKPAATAASALASLGARETIPDLLRLVEDPSVLVRLAVANALCTLGSRAGVPALLQKCADLRWPIREGTSNVSVGKSPGILNALRQPELWKRLKGTAVTPDLRSTRKANLERIAKAAGLSLDWSPSVQPDLDGWILGRRLRPQGIRGWTFLDELQHDLRGRWVGSRSPRYEAVLEPDRIRILTSDEALQFWTGWWKSEQEKK